MTIIDPTCRFCQRRMPCTTLYSSTPGARAARDRRCGTYTYQCARCVSEQSFDITGKPLDWSFIVAEKYIVYFWPAGKQFTVKLVASKAYENLQGRIFPPEFLVSLEVIPKHWTPQNTTEQRIKTLILFS